MYCPIKEVRATYFANRDVETIQCGESESFSEAWADWGSMNLQVLTREGGEKENLLSDSMGRGVEGDLWS